MDTVASVFYGSLFIFFVCVLIAAFPWVTRKIILLKNKTKLSIKRNADKHRLDDVFAVNTEATQKSSPVKIYLLIELVISMIQSAVDPRLWEGPGGFVGAVIGFMLFGLIPSYIVAVCITRQSPRIHKIACIVFCVLIFIVTARQIYEGMVYGG